MLRCSQSIWALEESTEVLLVLIDQLGRQVYSKVILDKQGTVLTTEETNRLSPGIYIVIGSSDNNVYGKKLVVTSGSAGTGPHLGL